MAISTYSTHGISVEFDDNSPQVLDALKRATNRGLEACGATAESYAKQELSRVKPHKSGPPRPNVITGRLRNSISHTLGSNVGSQQQVYIGTNVTYAAEVELGVPSKKWAYPYLKPAATEHTERYRQLLEDSLKNA